MIPDEIIRRRRIPPAYGNRIPHSECADQQPCFPDFDRYPNHVIGADPSDDIGSNGSNYGESMDTVDGKDDKRTYETTSPKLFAGSYSRRIDDDRTMIASDIRKYLSSNHVNPLGNSIYFERRRHFAKFSYSFY